MNTNDWKVGLTKEQEQTLAAARMSPETKARLTELVLKGDPHAAFMLRGIGMRLGTVQRTALGRELTERWLGGK